MYSEKVMDHFANPRNVGEIENANAVGQVGNAKCGDIMKIYMDIDENEIKSHFPHIYEHCLEHGYDITKQSIPVVPSQHYFMGGIAVDKVSATSMDRLYAIGETACNGVHGKNRLASNSLLESLVFAKRAAQKISENCKLPESLPETDLSAYKDTKTLQENYRQAVLKEIEKEKNYV